MKKTEFYNEKGRPLPEKGWGSGFLYSFLYEIEQKAVKRGFMWILTERDDLNEKHEE
jgi:hypothetical protein